jgi:hypothetical protein
VAAVGLGEVSTDTLKFYCGGEVDGVASGTPSINTDEVIVRPGESFHVDIDVENSVSIKAIAINDIEYSDGLTLTNAEWLLTGAVFSFVDINGDSLITFENIVNVNKAVMRLYFTVGSELADQDVYIRYKAKGINGENVVFDYLTEKKIVKVRRFIVGDCNGDEEITIDDAIYLAFFTFYSERYPIPNGMDVDFNNDGQVTIDDAIYLAFYTLK